ncbi:3-hydroxybutyrate dehydrogenase [Glutamicibacter nicotianae]|uniref:3-hydroxybutyrate dehydrogenase n=1 Tax=Glutamicibacter nicotianae TaxID=37929 RepID=UPI00195C2A64|nr:3-hydroxybutyrate dehydrogenase [Glutamicibacter nicotianae]MBM7769586.1 3-hydroxybutyrate dehydrogenase [Glutamicibacter nicotianae]
MAEENRQSPEGLAGRRALITGGASGIGLASATALTRAGAAVTIADVDEQAAGQAAQALGGKAWAVDLSDTKSLEELSLDIDILVNNAGVQRVAPIHEFDPEAWRLIHRLMLEAPFLLIRAALPGMRERGFGRIINVSSIHGLRASAFKSAYVAAKHGLEGLSKATAMEGADFGITSNCINPGYVRTPLVQKQIADQAKVHGIAESEVVQKIMLTEAAIKRMVEPEEVASLVAWLCGDAAGMVTGASYAMDGGWSAR